MSAEPKYVIPNLKKACQVLKFLGGSSDAAVLATICSELELPQTSALRIMRTLESEDLVQRDHKAYRLGPAVMQLCIHQEQSFDLRGVAVSAMEALTIATDETAHLAVPSGFRTMVVEVRESPNPIRASSRPGSVADSHCCAAGKLFIAHLFRERLAELIRECPLTARTNRTITTLAQLEEEVAVVFTQGYAVDDEEFYDGVRCLAAPVYDRKGKVIAAVGITASSRRFTRKRIKSVSKEVMAAASKITDQVII